MRFTIPVRITRTKRCREGFYLFVNGSRVHARTKRAAIGALQSVLALQSFQIVSVREYVERNRKRIARRMPPSAAQLGG